MSDDSNSDVQLSTTGQKVQGVTAGALGIVAVLLKAGLISAATSNPIALGITLFSSLLPSLFGHKQPPAGRSLLANEAATRPSGLAAAGAVVFQLVAILTALGAFMDQLPHVLPFLPPSWQPYIALVAAGVACITPGLQKLAVLLKGGDPS